MIHLKRDDSWGGSQDASPKGGKHVEGPDPPMIKGQDERGGQRPWGCINSCGQSLIGRMLWHDDLLCLMSWFPGPNQGMSLHPSPVSKPSMSRDIRIYAGGRIKNTPYTEAWSMYLKRLTWWNVHIIECQDTQWSQLMRRPQEWWVSLCERGKTMNSPQFASAIEQWMQQGKCVVFFIGSWDGLPPHIHQQCQASMALSAMTWPHLLARVMLLEQLYRAQQRLLRHPYSSV